MKFKVFARNTLEIRIGQYACLIICLFLMAVVPIWRDHKIFGIRLSSEDEEKVETVKQLDDGQTVINTTDIGKDILGYVGPTPVEITLKDGKIVKVTTLPNQETPEFIGAVRNSDLLDRLEGKTLEEAAATKLDAVSGATFTSNAVIGNINKGLAFALDPDKMPKAGAPEEFNITKFIITILIIIAGGVIPLFLKNKNYRTVQLVLNVFVLGFWGGTFICYSNMMSFMTNGITKAVLIPVALMLIAAFIYPMFGRTNHYCLWLCPYGSLQELIGKCWKKKITVPTRVVKILGASRNALWFLLMWLLWTGLWADWMGYEPFAAFFFKDASAVVLGIAGAFLMLSFVMSRPYCRFVCPTGTLFKLSEGRN